MRFKVKFKRDIHDDEAVMLDKFETEGMSTPEIIRQYAVQQLEAEIRECGSPGLDRLEFDREILFLPEGSGLYQITAEVEFDNQKNLVDGLQLACDCGVAGDFDTEAITKEEEKAL